MQNDTSPLLA